MSSSSSPSAGRTFLQLASELGFLTADAAKQLQSEATAKNLSERHLAEQQGYLDATQADIVETLLRPGEIVPGYEILGLLGRGGMGVVYRAMQQSLARPVALKTVLMSELADARSVDRFTHEAQAVARLTHPNIITAYDFGRHHGRVFFAMELVEGEDAAHLVSRTGPLDEHTAWGLARQAAEGLAHAAAHGIVHRDIKPANLLLVQPPAGLESRRFLPLLKIADFGLARLAEAGEQGAGLTQTGAVVGSPRYMAPEQFQHSAVDFRADMFALGLSVFQMLTGKPPLEGSSVPQILAFRLQGKYESARAYNPRVSQASEELLASLAATDPQQRPADYAELLHRIDGILSGMRPAETMIIRAAGQVGPAAPTRRLSIEATQDIPASVPRPRPNAWIGRATILLAVLAVLLAAWSFWLGMRGDIRPDLFPTGRASEQFNGENLREWQTVSGFWRPWRNTEGGRVLEGKGMLRRTLMLLDDSGEATTAEFFRLSLVVDLHEAEVVELHFALSDSGGFASYSALRIDHEGGTMVRQSGSAQVELSLPKVRHLRDTGPLHEIRLEQHTRGWWAYLDNQPLGSVLHRANEAPAEIRLLAEGGAAWISDLTCEELAPPRNKADGR